MIRTRRFVQFLAVVAFVTLVIVPPGPHSHGSLLHPYFLFDPYLVLLTLAGGGSLSLLAGCASLALVLLTMSRGAFFCWNLCPLGACQDAVPRLRNAGRGEDGSSSDDLDLGFSPGSHGRAPVRPARR